MADRELLQRLRVLRATGDCCQDLGGLVKEARAVPDREMIQKRFEALADENRLVIALMLQRRPDLCACELQAALHLSHPTISHHMRVLRDARLVEGERRGRWMHYRLTAAARTLLASG